jgi:acyl transferase domain-containing protein
MMGQSNGMAAPNGVAQQQLLEKALLHADVEAATVQYIETHGTGTRLGDPVEVQSIYAVYGKDRPAEQPLVIGALKTNIGHLEAAAGIAGFIKTVLSLHHGQIPASLHFEAPNRFIPWKDIHVQVANRLMPWPAYNGSRRAAISAFGLSGTNVHVILEAAAPVKEKAGGLQSGWPSYPFVLSAKTPQALQSLVAKYIHLLNDGTTYLPDLAYNAAVTRDAFRHRLAFEAASVPAARQLLQAYAGGGTKKTLLEGTTPDQRGELVWLFTGQGSQYWQMGRELYESSAVFKTVIDRCDKYLQTRWEVSLVSLLYGPEEETATALLRQTGYAQPALFAISCALAEVWKSWGVWPGIVAGHSAGEYAAACIAGVFSITDGLKLISERALLMQSLQEPGAMAVVFGAEALILQMIRPYGRDLAIAAVNGPELTVISGKRAAVTAVIASLKEAGIGSRELAVSHAFHSSLMEPMIDAFRKVAEGIGFTYRYYAWCLM